LNELEDVEAILRASCERVEITTTDHDAATVHDLMGLPSSVIHSLEMIAREPYVKLSLKPYEAALVYAGDVKSCGVASKIENVLGRCRRGQALNSVSWSMTLLSCAMLIYSWPSHSNFLLFVGMALAIAGFLFSQWQRGYRANHYATIILKRRIDSPSFWQRNQEKIYLHIINTIISFILGAFMTYGLMATRTALKDSPSQSPPKPVSTRPSTSEI